MCLFVRAIIHMQRPNDNQLEFVFFLPCVFQKLNSGLCLGDNLHCPLNCLVSLEDVILLYTGCNIAHLICWNQGHNCFVC